MKIILSGGGTLGSVSPLLAIREEIQSQNPSAEFLWIGTKYGHEKNIIQEYGIRYFPIPSGKFRRYFSLQNILDIPKIITAFFISLVLLKKEKPSIILSAGGFVSVPLVWAGWFLHIPSLIHQQDVRPGLANKIMSHAAKKITLSFEKSLQYFSLKKSVVTGNPARFHVLQKNKHTALKVFGFTKNLPVIFFLGGGTGAHVMNEFVSKNFEHMAQFSNIIHSYGKGRMAQIPNHPNYRGYEYMDKNLMQNAYAAADLIVSRGGMSALTEMAVLGKPVVVIPIPKSHQEENVKYFYNMGAVEIFDQKNLEHGDAVNSLRSLIEDKQKLEKLSENIVKIMPKDAGKRVAEEIVKLLKDTSPLKVKGDRGEL